MSISFNPVLDGSSTKYHGDPERQVVPIRKVLIQIFCGHSKNIEVLSGSFDIKKATVSCPDCQKLANRVFKGPGFPGERAIFTQKEKGWIYHRPETKMYRSLDFQSKNKGAFIKEFKLIQCIDHSFKLYIKFNYFNTDLFVGFLEKQNVYLAIRECEKGDGFFAITQDVSELKMLFKIIAEYNTFPEDIVDDLELLVKAASFKAKL